MPRASAALAHEPAPAAMQASAHARTAGKMTLAVLEGVVVAASGQAAAGAARATSTTIHLGAMGSVATRVRPSRVQPHSTAVAAVAPVATVAAVAVSAVSAGRVVARCT